MTISPITHSAEAPLITRSEVLRACGRGRFEVHNFLSAIVKSSPRTQKEIAEISGLSEATLSRAIRRPQNYTTNTINAIVHAAVGGYVEHKLVFPEQMRARSGADNDNLAKVYIWHQKPGRTDKYSPDRSNDDDSPVSLNTNTLLVQEKQYA